MCRTVRTVVLVVFAAGAPLAAQEQGNGEIEGGSPGLLERTTVEFRVTGGYTAGADLDEGDVRVGRLDTTIGTRTRLDDRSTLSLGFGSEFSFYDFADSGPFGVGGGVDSAVRYDFNALYGREIDDTWGWFAGGGVAASPAEGADWGDALTYSGVGGFTFRVSESLRLGAGVGVSTRLEDNARVIPVPTVEWQIDERWRLATTTRALRIRGLELSWEATEKLTLFALGGWAGRDFRLDKDGGPAPDGVLRDDRVPLYVGATVRPAERVQLDAGIGAVVWSNYELLDASGDRVAESDADPALSGWVGATIRF